MYSSLPTRLKRFTAASTAKLKRNNKKCVHSEKGLYALFFVYQKKSFLSRVSRAERLAPRYISNPPRSARVINGYGDHPMYLMSKVTVSKNSISNIIPPRAMEAPPNMNSLPFFRYFSNVTTVQVMIAIPPTTGKAKLINQGVPEVVRSIYKRKPSIAAKSHGTKITGLGFLNHKGKAKSK